MHFGIRFPMAPFCDEAGGGSGGGSGLIGSGITSSGSGGSGGSTGGSFGTSGGAAPIALSDDSMIQVPGQKDPIKYSDWKARYVDKADFTKTTQQYSAREKQYQAEIQRYKDAQARSAQPQQQQNPAGQQLAARMDALASAPYIDGKQAVQLVTDLYQQAIGPLAEAIKTRDQALALMYKKLQGVEGVANTLNSRTSQGDFKSLLASTKSSAGLPDDPEVEEFLQDIYLSHEGDDLNREFPNMVKKRFEALANVVRAMDKKRAQDARSRAAGIPTRGGQATPGRPLNQGHRSPQDRASAIWASLTGDDT